MLSLYEHEHEHECTIVHETEIYFSLKPPVQRSDAALQYQVLADNLQVLKCALFTRNFGRIVLFIG